MFPFSEKGFLGNETAILNVVTFWKHYWHKYMDKLGEATILEDEYADYLQKEGVLLKAEESDESEAEDDKGINYTTY